MPRFIFFSVLLSVCVAGLAQDVRGFQPEATSKAVKENGGYYALVIGINEYPSGLPSLKTAVADALEVSEVLRVQYGFDVKTLLNGEATRGQILGALASYRKTLGSNDNLLIYYAGHGYRDVQGDKNYWLPADAAASDSPNRIISDDLTTDVKVLPARHVLIVSDSCYAGGLSRAVDAPEMTEGKAILLKQMLSARSRTLMASGGDEPVADSGSGGHSVFAAALLRALKAADSEFSASDLFFTTIRPLVAGRSEQQPLYSILRNSDHDLGDFVFLRSTQPGKLINAIVALASEKSTAAPRSNSTPPAASPSPFSAGHTDVDSTAAFYTNLTQSIKFIQPSGLQHLVITSTHQRKFDWFINMSVMTFQHPIKDARLEVAFQSNGKQPWIENVKVAHFIENVYLISEPISDIGTSAVLCLTWKDENGRTLQLRQGYDVSLPPSNYPAPLNYQAPFMATGPATIGPVTSEHCQ